MADLPRTYRQLPFSLPDLVAFADATHSTDNLLMASKRASQAGAMAPPPPAPAPMQATLSAREPGLDEQVYNLLRQILPEHTAARVSAVVPYTPAQPAYDAGQNLAAGNYAHAAANLLQASAAGRLLPGAGRVSTRLGQVAPPTVVNPAVPWAVGGALAGGASAYELADGDPLATAGGALAGGALAGGAVGYLGSRAAGGAMRPPAPRPTQTPPPTQPLAPRMPWHRPEVAPFLERDPRLRGHGWRNANGGIATRAQMREAFGPAGRPSRD